MIELTNNYFEAERNLLAEFQKISRNKEALYDLCDNSRLIKQIAANCLLQDKDATNEDLIKVIQRSWIYRQAAGERLVMKNKIILTLTKEQLKIMAEKNANKSWALRKLKEIYDE